MMDSETARWRLINHVNRALTRAAVAGARKLSFVWEASTGPFAEAFPGAVAACYLRDGEDSQWRFEQGWGNSPAAVPKLPEDLLDKLMAGQSATAVPGIPNRIFVPVEVTGQIIGLLLIDFPDQALIVEPDLACLATFAGQIGMALAQVLPVSGKPAEQAQRELRELTTLYNASAAMMANLELNVVLDAITKAALELISAGNVHIFLYEPQSDTFRFGSARWFDGRRVPAVPLPRPDGLTAHVVSQGAPIVINDAPNHPFFRTAATADWGLQAIAGFPLKRGGRVLGAFTLAFLEPHTFSQGELLLMSVLADQAAVAVENAHLFADTQRRLREMSALVDMAKQVTGNLKVGSVMQTTVQLVQMLLNARASTIALLSGDGDELVIEAAAGINPKWVHKARMKLGEGVSGLAVSERRPVYIRNTHNQPNFLFFDEVVRSLLAVPLLSRDEALGSLTVDSDQPNAFDESHIQLMTIAAAQVSVAIANARLYEEAEDRAAKLAVAYEELKENDRLKDELVQNVSHELRTPLTFVKGYVDLLMAGDMGSINDQQQCALQIVADKTVEITRLIDDIMSLQRIDSSNLILEEFSLSALLQESIAGHRLNGRYKGIELDLEAPRFEVVLVADRVRINQAVNNLIVNAMKFSPDGGTVRVVLSADSEEAQIAVFDEGIGVPWDKLDRIFERFYQVDGSSRRRFGGTGIGLALVKRIVVAHHGRVWAKSSVSHGSTFFMALPRQLSRSVESVVEAGSKQAE
jgi:signal transduction histidine kinase